MTEKEMPMKLRTPRNLCALHRRVLERWVVRECDDLRPLHRYPEWWPACLSPLSVRVMREIRRRHDAMTRRVSP